MKDAGIGTPATRAAIIETLFAREYVRREKKSLVPTDKGLAVYAVVRDKKIADVAMTGGWGTGPLEDRHREMDAPTFHRGIEVFASQIAKELLEASRRRRRSVVFYPKLAKCQNPDCGLTVWRTVARKELTDKQLAELLTKGKTGTIRGFVQKRRPGRSTRPSRLMTSSRPRSFSSRAILPGRERGTNGNNRYLCHWKRPVITRYACLIRIFSVVGASGGNPGRLLFPDYQRPLKFLSCQTSNTIPPRGNCPITDFRYYPTSRTATRNSSPKVSSSPSGPTAPPKRTARRSVRAATTSRPKKLPARNSAADCTFHPTTRW